MKFLKYGIILLLVQGCASTLPVTPQDIMKAASPAFNGGFKLYYVPSRRSVMDAQFVALSKTSPDSGMATELAAVLAGASEGKVNIAVGGPNSAKSAVVIQNAITLQQGKALPNLHLVFVGNSSDAQAPEESVTSAGGEFSFVQYGL